MLTTGLKNIVINSKNIKILLSIVLFGLLALPFTRSYFTHSVESRDNVLSTGVWVSEGGVIVNEIMWGGSSEHELDQWIELRNMLDVEVDISGWEIVGAGPDGHSVFIEDGTVIEPGGYFLIAHYGTDEKQGNKNFSAINDSIIPDQIDKLLLLSNNGEQLVLKTAEGVVIDMTPEVQRGRDGGWAAGTKGSPGANSTGWRSMQRVDGTELVGDEVESWETCTHEDCNSGIYWKIGDGPNYGTPGHENI